MIVTGPCNKEWWAFQYSATEKRYNNIYRYVGHDNHRTKWHKSKYIQLYFNTIDMDLGHFVLWLLPCGLWCCRKKECVVDRDCIGVGFTSTYAIIFYPFKWRVPLHPLHNPAHCEMYSVHIYMIKFLRYLLQSVVFSVYSTFPNQ